MTTDRSMRHRLVLAATALAGLLITFLAWHGASLQAEQDARDRFEIRLSDLSHALRGRMLDYEQVLRGAGGLASTSELRQPRQWSAYASALELQTSYPGIHALGYASYLPAQGALPARTPIRHLWPDDEANQQVVGFDMFSEPERRAAMERARDTAEPVATGSVTLLQDRDLPGTPRPGFLVYLPVYGPEALPGTLEERRAGLSGFVFASFRAADLIVGTLGRPAGMHIRLLDLTDRAAVTVLFDAPGAIGAPRFAAADALVVRGRTWRLEAASLPAFDAENATDRPLIVLGAGLASSLLLTVLMWSLLTTRARATELARRMTAANEELERFRIAVDRHFDTMIMVDADRMRIVYVNEGACRTLGYSREELVGQPPDIVFADRTAKQLAAEYRRLAETEEGTAIEHGLFRRKDGSALPVEISREVLRRNSSTFVLGIARDISARLDAERALREAGSRLSLALENSGLALCDWDVNSGLVHLGKEWRAILGGKPEPSVTPMLKLEMLVHPDDLPALRQRVRALLAGDIASYRLEHRVLALDGQYKWIESVARVSERDGTGHAVRVTGTNADISERKAVAELKNAFIANVSHELRTPLTGILASLELIREGATGELPPEARRFVEMAHSNGERLAKLIEDILDLERVESGRMRLAMQTVSVGEILGKAASLNATYAERYRARLRVSEGGGALQVTADPDRLLQVLTNLVSNAAKYSPPGGQILLSARSLGDRVEVSVTDEGPGVPEQFRERLFGKFEQAERGKGGTGLGLAISKAMLERMGGHIGCENIPGLRGARFYFDLPKASAP